MTVRRIQWRIVITGTGRNFLRCAASYRHDKDFVIRAGRFDFVDVAGVSQLLSVRRNRIHVLATKIKRGHIVIVRREIARLEDRRLA